MLAEHRRRHPLHQERAIILGGNARDLDAGGNDRSVHRDHDVARLQGVVVVFTGPVASDTLFIGPINASRGNVQLRASNLTPSFENHPLLNAYPRRNSQTSAKQQPIQLCNV